MDHTGHGDDGSAEGGSSMMHMMMYMTVSNYLDFCGHPSISFLTQ